MKRNLFAMHTFGVDHTIAADDFVHPLGLSALSRGN